MTGRRRRRGRPRGRRRQERHERGAAGGAARDARLRRVRVFRRRAHVVVGGAADAARAPAVCTEAGRGRGGGGPPDARRLWLHGHRKEARATTVVDEAQHRLAREQHPRRRALEAPLVRAHRTAPRKAQPHPITLGEAAAVLEAQNARAGAWRDHVRGPEPLHQPLDAQTCNELHNERQGVGCCDQRGADALGEPRDGGAREQALPDDSRRDEPGGEGRPGHPGGCTLGGPLLHDGERRLGRELDRIAAPEANDEVAHAELRGSLVEVVASELVPGLQRLDRAHS